MKRIIQFPFFILFFFFSFCNISNKKIDSRTDILQGNKQLFKIIEDYTKQVHCAYCKGSYPSNHVFFHPYKNDTIMTIYCLPNLTNNDLWWKEKLAKDKWWTNFEKSNKHYAYTPDGIFWFTKRKPIIFYNTYLYKSNFKPYLSKTIPDTLNGKMCFASFHDLKKWYFLYKEGKFIKIELKKDTTWKDKPYNIAN